MTTEQFKTRANASLEAANASEIETKINLLHRTAETLQSFAAQSKRKLSRAKALEQASILSGFKDYQTAKAAIEESAAEALALSKHHMSVFLERNTDKKGQDGGPITKQGVINGELSAWEAAMSGGCGMYEIDQGRDHVSVRLAREDSPETSIQVTVEMDGGIPRVIIYRPDEIDEPLFSMHAASQGTVVQYMSQSGTLLDKDSAPKEVEKLMNRLTDSNMPAWFIPTPEEI